MKYGFDVPLMVFDVESSGLHGEGFAVGWAIMGGGRLMADGIAVAPVPERVEWVEKNVIPHLPQPTHGTMREIRDEFWRVWSGWRNRGALLAADVPWPVEARFLARCVDDDPGDRYWDGPYPLIDIASLRLAVGRDPLAPVERTPFEQPMHNPLADARQSARLALEVLAS